MKTNLFLKSFKTVTDQDIKEAFESNKVIKYVCESTLENGNINISVYPKVFEKTHLFANVNYEVNAVILDTYPNDTLSFNSYTVFTRGNSGKYKL